MNLSIIIPILNTAEVTKKCIQIINNFFDNPVK